MALPNLSSRNLFELILPLGLMSALLTVDLESESVLEFDPRLLAVFRILDARRTEREGAGVKRSSTS